MPSDAIDEFDVVALTTDVPAEKLVRRQVGKRENQEVSDLPLVPVEKLRNVLIYTS